MSEGNERLEYVYAYGRLTELVRQLLAHEVDIAHLHERYSEINRDLARRVIGSDQATDGRS